MPDALFDRLASFRIDPPGVALPFARRLAHENGWSPAFAERAVAEYRRFVWLAMRAGHPVTPSPAVDEVWHLHLCYTHSYWDELCGGVLGRPLHHGPTRGGAAEGAKFADWYARTLASYRQHFGEPPADLWPAPAERFRGGIPRKVDARSHWVVSKARVRALAARSVRVAVLLLLLVSMAACVDLSEPESVALVAILGLGGVLAIVVVVLLVRGRSSERRGDADSGCGAPTGCAVSGCGGLRGHHGHGHGVDGGDRHGDTGGGGNGGDGGGGDSSGGDGGSGCGGGGGGCGGGGD